MKNTKIKNGLGKRSSRTTRYPLINKNSFIILCILLYSADIFIMSLKSIDKSQFLTPQRWQPCSGGFEMKTLKTAYRFSAVSWVTWGRLSRLPFCK